MNFFLVVIAVVAVILLFAGGLIAVVKWLFWVGVVLALVAIIVWLLRLIRGSRSV
ncbi:MAG TPA: hypothetical protein VFQ96_02925 [Microbacteriaceae bacterium]|nr:hypothetical protein [Microbacteriaceae bacterium]